MDGHIKPLRLFDLARGSAYKTTEEEIDHLLQCGECQRLLAVFDRQFTGRGPKGKAVPAT